MGLLKIYSTCFIWIGVVIATPHRAFRLDGVLHAVYTLPTPHSGHILLKLKTFTLSSLPQGSLRV